MDKIKAQRSGELFVKNMHILQLHFAMQDLETTDCWQTLGQIVPSRSEAKLW